ncbi:hypothetical protein ROHU_004440 [Labeo rohita]|uniref:Uncharacterized protein n=1 Tax=Labeo rohita TaxID=84645 RepID=A0A498NMA8_LABRO|nr:hypothetical protein ROHU_004440 [Labeo rohita]
MPRRRLRTYFFSTFGKWSPAHSPSSPHETDVESEGKDVAGVESPSARWSPAHSPSSPHDTDIESEGKDVAGVESPSARWSPAHSPSSPHETDVESEGKDVAGVESSSARWSPAHSPSSPHETDIESEGKDVAGVESPSARWSPAHSPSSPHETDVKSEGKDVAGVESSSARWSPAHSPSSPHETDIESEGKDVAGVESPSARWSPAHSPSCPHETDVESEGKDVAGAEAPFARSIAYTFCKLPLESLSCMYYDIITGQLKDIRKMPILHRCLSHIMKNAKVFCKKHSPKHYRLSMHLFGLLTSAATLMEMDDIIISMTVVFSSSHSGDNVQKHFQNLQNRMERMGMYEGSYCGDNDFQVKVGPTPFHTHFEEIMANAPVCENGEPNEYHSPTFMPSLLKYFLPQAPLWSGLMLGDLGRHGKGPAYKYLSNNFMRCRDLSTQNYTEDNKTQGVMEKSQWDLKKIRFQRRRLTRLDDFVHIYQHTHNALLMEFSDSVRKKKVIFSKCLPSV